MIQLIIIEPDGKRRHQKLACGMYTIGRSFFADFRLSDKSIGKTQIDLIVDENSISLNGSRIDDKFLFNGIDSSAVSNIVDTDLVHLGNTEISFKLTKDISTHTESVEHATRRPDELKEKFRTINSSSEPDAEVNTEQTTTIDNSVNGYLERVEIRRAIQAVVQKQLDLYQREKLTGMKAEELRAEATRLAREVVQKRQVTIPNSVDQNVVIEEVVSESIGLGPLEPLLADPTVTEVMVNGPRQIYIERNGRLVQSGVEFIDDRSLMAIIERVVSPLGRRIDEGSPLVDARLPDGSRVNAIIPPLSLVGPVMTIRKFSDKKLSMERLAEMQSLSPEMAEFLTFCVLQRKNIVISGGTGSGKTTFLNALSDSIPERERIVTIEDAAELRLHQQHVISLESRPENVEGKGLITIRDLVRNSLRMRPDRIIVGECRDGAALDMLQAMNTGHDGSLTTGHANSPRDLLSRLEVMCLMSDIDLPSRALREQISSAVDIIVQQIRFNDGSRRVTSIVEVDGIESDTILLNNLFEFRQTGINKDGKIEGYFTGLNRSPQFYSELEKTGLKPNRSLFVEKRPVNDIVNRVATEVA